VTADKSWSDWPLDPTYVLAMRSAAMSVARGASQQDNVLAGQPIQINLAEGQQALEPQVKLPGGEVAPAELVRGEKQASALRFARTSQSGPYAVSAGLRQSRQGRKRVDANR
jgi:hypothetical protein